MQTQASKSTPLLLKIRALKALERRTGVNQRMREDSPPWRTPVPACTLAVTRMALKGCPCLLEGVSDFRTIILINLMAFESC